MAVTKRLRYEVLRRDSHRCRYCGKTALENELTVDHVTPTALGGSDKPENLVAACRDCNAGKSASSPDAPIIADIESDALRWAAAMKRAAELQAEDIDKQHDREEAFYSYWLEWGVGDGEARVTFEDALPGDWRRTLEIFHRAGVTGDEMAYAVKTTMGKPGLPKRDLWKYMCGFIWRQLDKRQELARELIAKQEELPASAPAAPPEWMTPEIERYMQLTAQHPFLDELECTAWDVVVDARRKFPDMDFIATWYGYPTFVEHYGKGIKHRLLEYTNAHDFDDKDEHICYQILNENMRYAWETANA